MTVFLALVITTSLNLLSIIYLGWYRGYRRRVNRRRGSRMTADEQFVFEMRETSKKQLMLARREGSMSTASDEAPLPELPGLHCDVPRMSADDHIAPSNVMAMATVHAVTAPSLARCVPDLEQARPPPETDRADAGAAIGAPDPAATDAMLTTFILSDEAPHSQCSSRGSSNRSGQQEAWAEGSNQREGLPRTSGYGEGRAAAVQSHDGVSTRQDGSRSGPSRRATAAPSLQRGKGGGGWWRNASRGCVAPPRVAPTRVHSNPAHRTSAHPAPMSPPPSPPDDARSKRQRRAQERLEMLETLREKRRSMRASKEEATPAPSDDATAGLMRKVAAKLRVFGGSLYENTRTEHMLISFIAPYGDDEELTRVQVVQIFWNTLYLELALLCLMHAPVYTSQAGGSGGRRKGGGAQAAAAAGSVVALDASAIQVSLVTALTQGVLVALFTFWMITFLAYVFRLGNSHHHSPTTLAEHVEQVKYLCRRIWRVLSGRALKETVRDKRRKRRERLMKRRLKREYKKLKMDAFRKLKMNVQNARRDTGADKSPRRIRAAWMEGTLSSLQGRDEAAPTLMCLPMPPPPPPPTPERPRLPPPQRTRTAIPSRGNDLEGAPQRSCTAISSRSKSGEPVGKDQRTHQLALRQECFDRQIQFSISDSAARLQARIDRHDAREPQREPPVEALGEPALPASLPPSPPAAHEWTSALPLPADNLTWRPVGVKGSATVSPASQQSRPLKRLGTRASLRAAPSVVKRTFSASVRRLHRANTTTAVPKAQSAATQLAIATLAAKVAHRKKEVRWRGSWIRRARLAAAWFVNLFAAFIFLFYAFIVRVWRTSAQIVHQFASCYSLPPPSDPGHTYRLLRLSVAVHRSLSNSERRRQICSLVPGAQPTCGRP